MKTKFDEWLAIGASTLLLSGCCAGHHVARWEYKVVPSTRITAGGPTEWRAKQEAMMNDLAKEGWVFLSQSDQHLYFKRAAK